MMRAITLWQPWADAVIFLGKNVENRPRNMGYRGEIAIHVGLNANPDFTADLHAVAEAMDRSRHTSADVYRKNPLTLAALMKRRRGCIIGTVEIVRWVKYPQIATSGWLAGSDPVESSPWAFGPWCAILRNPRPLATPVIERSAFHRGIWTVPPDVEQTVLTQLGRTMP